MYRICADGIRSWHGGGGELRSMAVSKSHSSLSNSIWLVHKREMRMDNIVMRLYSLKHTEAKLYYPLRIFSMLRVSL